MRPPLLAAITVAAVLLLLPGPSAASGAETFVLVVANNRSLRPHLPDLQYADDDAIRYYQLWQTLLPGARITLLTEPDLDTARANPRFSRLARPATRQNLLAEVRAMTASVGQARAAGRHTTFYFVFAGHGDVDGGRGFVELADGRLGADELEKLVDQVAAARSHLILDSCNSYFMVRPRKPGGRPLTAKLVEQVGQLSVSPDVGAFLSTSTEQTVYEWSEIQSGIFSYLVRSGLMGGADANADGRITYDELRAFVAVASGSVPNPAVRPNVFARGPGGQGGEVLVDLADRNTHTLSLPPGQRFILRDQDGFRLAELHTEAGFSPTVRLWGGTALSVEATMASGAPIERPTRLFYDLPDSGRLALSALPSRPPRAGGRGGDRMFEALFQQPWGPSALARQQVAERAAPPAVYGLSRADAGRMELHLDALAQSVRGDRLRSAYWQGVVGLGFGIAGIAERDPWGAGIGGFFGALALWNLLPTDPERLAARGRRAAASGADPGTWLPPLAEDLESTARSARRWRLAKAGGLGLMALWLSYNFVDEARQPGAVANDQRLFYTLGILGFTGAMGLYLRESNLERQSRALLADPLWQGVSLAAAPQPGGLQLSLRGKF